MLSLVASNLTFFSLVVTNPTIIMPLVHLYILSEYFWTACAMLSRLPSPDTIPRETLELCEVSQVGGYVALDHGAYVLWRGQLWALAWKLPGRERDRRPSTDLVGLEFRNCHCSSDRLSLSWSRGLLIRARPPTAGKWSINTCIRRLQHLSKAVPSSLALPPPDDIDYYDDLLHY